MQGEEQQFRQDQMMYDRDRGQYDSADQSDGAGQSDRAGPGDWVVGQDSDFGGGGADDSGSSGDW